MIQTTTTNIPDDCTRQPNSYTYWPNGCPSCGRCPTCGRGYPSLPSWPYPYPYWNGQQTSPLPQNICQSIN